MKKKPSDPSKASRLLRIYDAWMGLWFGDADPRVYATFRIAFSLAVLINLIDIWPERQTLLSRDGMIDHGALLTAIGDQPYFSVFHHFDSQAEVTTLMLVAATAIVCLGLGLFARISVVLVYVWHLSFFHAVFPATNGWDRLVVIYSLLLMVSPLGKCWSLPAVWNHRFQDVQPVSRHGLVLMRYQLLLVYFATAWSKVNDNYWRNGDFMAYFQMSIYSRFPIQEWAEWHVLSAIMTYGALATELAIPLLLMRRKYRWIAIGLGVALHGGIAFNTNLGVFSLVILSTYTAFLTSNDIDRFVRTLQKAMTWLEARHNASPTMSKQPQKGRHTRGKKKRK